MAMRPSPDPGPGSLLRDDGDAAVKASIHFSSRVITLTRLIDDSLRLIIYSSHPLPLLL